MDKSYSSPKQQNRNDPTVTSPENTSPMLQPQVTVVQGVPVQRYPAPKLGVAEEEETDYNEVPTYPTRPSYKEYHAQLRPASQPVVFDGCPDNPYQPASVPIYQTATFQQPSSTEFGAYDYTRSGNPTRTALERQIAMLENAHAAFCFTSGMSALNSVTRLLQQGDTIAVGSDIYGGMHRLVSRVTSLYGVQVQFVPTWDIEAVRTLLESDETIKLLHMETPSNPMMRITDIRVLADLLHENDVLLSVDSTMMTPHLQRPLNHGADIVVHSLTKFFGGHSDTMGGVVAVASESLAKQISFFQNAEGTGLAPFDCWLFLRGIKTMAIRVERAQSNAMHIAQFLNRQPMIQKIYYAGLEPSKEQMLQNGMEAVDFKLHMGQAKGGGSVLSFTTGNVTLSQAIIDNLRLFKLTVSFGSCNSLCEMPATLSHASIPAHERVLPDDLIRLSVGIEDVNDLIDDLQQALLFCSGSVSGSMSAVTPTGSSSHSFTALDLNDSSAKTSTPSASAAVKKSRQRKQSVSRPNTDSLHLLIAFGLGILISVGIANLSRN